MEIGLWGTIEFPAIPAKLNELNYQGWIVIEQDVLSGMGSPKESTNAIESI